MSVTIKCPSCQNLNSIPEAAYGKQVRCGHCQNVFLVKAPGPAPVPPPPPPPPSVVLVEDESPPPKPKPSPKPPAPKAKTKPKPPPPPVEEAPFVFEEVVEEKAAAKPPPKKKKGSPVFMILGIVGGVFLLLCLGCGSIVGYVIYQGSQAYNAFNNEFGTEFNNFPTFPTTPTKPVTVPTIPTTPATKPTPVDTKPKPIVVASSFDALKALKSETPGDADRALDWLGRAPVDPVNQVEIARALETLLANAGPKQNAAAKALGAWADEDSVPFMVEALKNPKNVANNALRSAFLQALSRLNDPRAFEPLAKELGDPVLGEEFRQTLAKMNRSHVEKAVLPYYNEPFDATLRDRARKLLKEINVGDDVTVKQTLTDMKATDKARQQAAWNTLDAAEVNATMQREVCFEVENTILADKGPAEMAFEVLKRWAHKDSTPALLKVLDEPGDTPASAKRHTAALNILRELKDERASAALAKRLASKDPETRQLAIRALEGIGLPAEKEVLKYADDPNLEVRTAAMALLKSIGSKESAEGKAALADLKSPDAARRKEGLAWVLKSPPDDGKRTEVAAALEAMLGDADATVREQAVQALAKWGTADNVKALAKLLKDPKDEIRQAAIEALGATKDEAAIKDLIPLLSAAKDRPLASKALQAIGEKAETEVLNLLTNPDTSVKAEACRILKVIGTKKSLQSLMRVRTAAQGVQLDVFKEASQAIQEINKR